MNTKDVLRYRKTLYTSLEHTPMILGEDVGRPTAMTIAVLHGTRRNFFDIQLATAPHKIIIGDTHTGIKKQSSAYRDTDPRLGVSSYLVASNSGTFVYVEKASLPENFRDQTGLRRIHRDIGGAAVSDDVRFGGFNDVKGYDWNSIGLIGCARDIVEALEHEQIDEADRGRVATGALHQVINSYYHSRFTSIGTAIGNAKASLARSF